MLIDVPVYICFNAERADIAYRSTGNQVFGSTFTLRFDPEDTEVPAQYAGTYPVRDTTRFYPFEPNSIFDFMPRNAEKRLVELANRDPESYFVDQDAAKVIEETAQQEREAHSQFGVGA